MSNNSRNLLKSTKKQKNHFRKKERRIIVKRISGKVKLDNYKDKSMV